MKRVLLAVGWCVLASVACGGGASTKSFRRPPLGAEGRLPTPDGAFRSHPPSPSHASVFAPPPIVEAKLANGVRLLVVEKHDLPIVTLRLVSSHGPDAAPPGVGALWARSVFRGTKDLEGKNVHFMLTAHAIQYGAFVWHEASNVELRMLSAEVPRAIEILGMLMHEASFPEKDFERSRDALNDWLEERIQTRDVELWDEGLRQIYPKGHPYRSDVPTTSVVSSVKREDVVAYHAATFSVDRSTIVVAGDVTAKDLVPRLEKAFQWMPSLAPEPKITVPRPEKAKGPEVTYVDHPGDAQALVSTWWVGVPMTDPDYLAVQLAIDRLRVRLIGELRTDEGITYGVGAHLGGGRLGPPPLVLQSAIDRKFVGGAVATILTEVRRLSESTLEKKTFARERDGLVDDWGSLFETTDSTVGLASILPLMSLPDDEYTKWGGRLAALGPDDVQRAAKTYMPIDAVQLIVEGDEATIRPQIEAALSSAPRAGDDADDAKPAGSTALPPAPPPP